MGRQGCQPRDQLKDVHLWRKLNESGNPHLEQDLTMISGEYSGNGLKRWVHWSMVFS